MATIKIIIDGKSVNVGSGGGNPKEVYSTEETRIGTWIDGKPLYRKVFTSRFPSSMNSGQSDVGKISNAETIVSLYGFGPDGDVENKYPLPSSGHDGYIELYAYRYPAAYTGIFIYTKLNVSSLGLQPFHVIVEYTKTTDQATVLTERADKVVETDFTPTAAVTATHTELNTGGVMDEREL